MLDCSYTTGSYHLIGNLYYCSGRILAGGSESNIEAIYGTHQSGFGNEDVLGLSISSQNMEYFPTSIESFFPNLIAIYFPFNDISFVTNDHLKPFPNLQYFSIINNKITALDSNLFDGLNSLKLVRFTKNNIQHVGHDIRFSETGEVSFALNPCIDRFATTTDEITALKFYLLVSCPPSISLIEATLESRSNLITKNNGQVQRLNSRTDFLEESHSILKEELADLKKINMELETRIAILEGIIEKKLGFKIEDLIN